MVIVQTPDNGHFGRTSRETDSDRRRTMAETQPTTGETNAQY